MKRTIALIIITLLLMLSIGLESISASLQVKEYLEGKFPAIFIIYLESLAELDESEKEFIDLLEGMPADEQRIFVREVYEEGFSAEILTRLKEWKQRVEKPFLKVAFPGQDYQKIRGNPIFVYGCAFPSREVKVTVNGAEVEKFDPLTGNFLTMVEIPAGIEYTVKVAASLEGAETSLARTVIYEPSWQEMPTEPLAIHPSRILPKQNQLLSAGEQLRVIVQGSPGAEAVFRIGNSGEEYKMTELESLPSPLTGKGVYYGSYLIKDSDIPTAGKTESRIITVILRSGSREISRVLPGKATFTSNRIPRIVEVIDDRTRFYRIREDSFNLYGETLGGDGWLTQVMGLDLLSGTRFQAIGRAGEYVRVRLGSDNYLIPQSNVREVSVEQDKPQSVLSGITIRDTRGQSEIHFNFNDKKSMPFLIEDEADQLTLTLYGAELSENIKIAGTSSSVKGIEFATQSEDRSISESATVINIKLYHLLAGFDYYRDDSGLVISIRKLPDIFKDNPLKGRIIVIDPGHGGNATGAIGPGDVHEKEAVLEISRYLKQMLVEKGARVIMTRLEDVNVNIAERIDLAVREQADLFVSIHANAHAEGSDAVNYHGHMTLYNYNFNKQLAELILDNLAKETGLPKARVWERPDLGVLRRPQVPSVLVETAFLMHPDDNRYLLLPEYQQQLAFGILSGISDYFLNLISSN